MTPRSSDARRDQGGTAAGGKGRTLAARMPRLILEARRVAATVIHGLHGRSRAGPGENFWQYRRFIVGRAGASRRLAPLRARRPSLCARAGMGSRPYGLDLGRPLALDGLPLPRSRMEQARPRSGRGLRACRSPGAGRRARRHAGLMRPTGSRNVLDKMADAIVHDRNRASEPAAVLRALRAGRDRAAVGLLEPDRGISHAPWRSCR